jgi:putative membrane protein
MPLLTPMIKKNDKLASQLIWVFSFVVFAAVILLGRIKLEVDLGFDVHVFAFINACINATVAVLLVAALVSVKIRCYSWHRSLMITALLLSVLFLLSYIAHHLLAGETKFGGEGTIRTIYYIILFTHIPLAGMILPFILFTAYRGLIGEWPAHRKLAKITWPIWFYVAITGVVVYLMISPYYS